MLPCSAEFAELVVGPIDASANHVRLMRYRWENGGERAVQEHYREAGRRAWELVAICLPAKRAAAKHWVAICRLPGGIADLEWRISSNKDGALAGGVHPAADGAGIQHAATPSSPSRQAQAAACITPSSTRLRSGSGLAFGLDTIDEGAAA